MAGRVAWISIAPVKGLALCSLERATLTEHGVAENRRFHLIDDRGRLVNGKLRGHLVQIGADYDASAERLTLRLPSGEVVEGAADALDGEVTTIFYGRPVPGRLVAGPFSHAISQFAGEPLRLVRPERVNAAVDRGQTGAVSMVSTRALESIAEAAGCDGPLDGRRFRMLFGIDGVEAHAEDGWLRRPVRVGAALVEPRGHVGRCTITSQDPDTGVRDVDTLSAIRDYRGGIESTEPLPFGVYGRVLEPGETRLGDPVEPA